jgi:ribose 5-phosphate isomerase B
MKNVYFASDHGGFELKQKLIPYVASLGFEVEDFGNTVLDPEDDYPDFVIPLSKKVSSEPESKGIILGGSGQGEAIVANRFRGVRAMVFNGQYEPKEGRPIPPEIHTSREHNDSNVLSLGARFLNEAEAKQAVKEWLETPFPGEERHVRRIKKIDAITNNL